jgi:hypothetical protein
MDFYEWVKEDELFITDLLIQLGSDLVQMFISTVIAVVLVFLVVVFGPAILASSVIFRAC